MLSSSGNVEDDLTPAVRRFDSGVCLVRLLEMKAPRKLRSQPTFDHPVEDLRQALARCLDRGSFDPYPCWNRMRRHWRRGKGYHHPTRLERLKRAHVRLAPQGIEHYVVWAGVGNFFSPVIDDAL